MYYLVQPELRAAAAPALLSRGCVNVIGLEPIKAQAGPRWNKIKDGVHTRLETILRQNLSSTDFFAPLNDCAFLITMPSSNAADAQVTCLRIAHDLYKSYLGTCDFGTLEIFTASEGENGSLALSLVMKDALLRLAHRAGLVETTSAHPHLEFTPCPTDTSPAIRFAPLWDCRNEAITGNVCLIPRPPPAQPSETATLFDAAARLRMKYELDTLYRGIGILLEHLERGERFLMVFRVTFDTIGSPVGRMNSAPPAARFPPICAPISSSRLRMCRKASRNPALPNS